MVLYGGLRDRMLLQAFYDAIKADLTARNWFDPNRQHSPIVMIDQYPRDDEPPAVNTLAISMGDAFHDRAEMGSLSVDHEAFMYADFYAESDALSRHVAGDIAAWLMDNPRVPVVDYEDPLRPIEFYAYVTEGTVDVTRPTTASNAWQKHWSIVSWSVEDLR